MKIQNVTRLLKDGPRSTLTGVDIGSIRDSMEKDKQSKLVPTNTHILVRAKKYKEDLPSLLSSLEKFRDTLLESVYPQALSVVNGLADSDEVMVAALGENSSVKDMQPLLETYMLEAVKSRLTFMVADCFNMTDAEMRLYLLRVLGNEGFSNDRLQTVLHEVQSLANLHRTTKGASLQLPELSAHERSGKRLGVQSDQSVSGPARTRRAGRGRTESAEDEEIHRKLRQSRRAGPRR